MPPAKYAKELSVNFGTSNFALPLPKRCRGGTLFLLLVLCALKRQMFPDDPVTPIEKRAPSTNPIGKFFEGLLSPVNTAGMKGPEIEPPPQS